jgi:hypothetical protein
MRLRLWNESSYNQDDGSYCIAGVVEDYKFGPSRQNFKIFVKAGYGVHPGLTAVIDCIDLGLASKSGTIKLNDTSYGYFKSLVMDKYADDDTFRPFTSELY